MVIIQITEKLFDEIESKFKRDSTKIFNLFETLNDNPKKGKQVGVIGGVVVKELKYKTFRFYFITDGFKLKILQKEELTELLLQFVRMSNKKYQQQIIDEIKKILLDFGPDYFAGD